MKGIQNKIFTTLTNFFNKLSTAGLNIATLNINNYFGGALCLSPKDINRTETDNLKKDVIEKLETFINSWNQDNKELNNNIENQNNTNQGETCQKNQLFGLFKN